MKTVKTIVGHGHTSLCRKFIHFNVYQLSTPSVLKFILKPKLTIYARFYWREYEFLQVLGNIEKLN